VGVEVEVEGVMVVGFEVVGVQGTGFRVEGSF
jgi:hypothetical protein